MPMSEPSGGNRTEYDHLNNVHILPDPLLEDGTFIDANSHRADKNGDVECTEPSQDKPFESEEEGRTFSATETAAAEPPLSRRPRRGPEEAAATERPEWLPEGWGMNFKVRSSGVTAGTIDRYYIEPTSGRRFRSKKEVFHFLETGSKRKRKLNPDADGMPSETPEGHKEGKSGSRSKKSAALNFDFKNPPKMVSWSLSDASEDQWTPSIGDEKVPESTKRDWAAVFDHICNS